MPPVCSACRISYHAVITNSDGGTACITSRGLGALGVPLRIFSPAEVVVLELERAAEGTG